MIINVVDGNIAETSIQGAEGSIIKFSLNAIGNIEMSCGSLPGAVIFDHEARFHFMATIAEFSVLCHPELPPELSMKLIKESGGNLETTPSILPYQRSTSPSANNTLNGFTGDMLEAVSDIETLKMALRNAFANEPSVTQKTCRVLWAIGNSRWNRGMDGLNIISAIQMYGSELYARSLVDSANKNDLSGLEDLYARTFNSST